MPTRKIAPSWQKQQSGRLFSGYGYNLPSEATLTIDHRFSSKSTAEKELLNNAFVDKFAGQIKALIKREPRLAKNENRTYSIFYE
jgi:hypothetical protein